jgi:hypothetical protein
MNLIVSEPAIDAIINASNKRQAIEISSTRNGSLTIKPLGLCARLWHWNDKNYHERRLSELAAVVSSIVSLQPRMSIPTAAKDKTIKAARNLLKEIRHHNIQTPSIDKLQKEVTAAKLGINAEILDKNPGLQQFIEIHHLERYLLIYGDTLKIDQLSQQVLLRKENTFVPCQEIIKEINATPVPTKNPSHQWIYGPEGIQNKDMYDWSALKPFMKGDPAEWNHQYVFEFCACYNPFSIKNGNHSWLRLKTPTGDIYSVGLYRPGKADWTDNLKMPLRIKPGYLMQPDVSEFWDFPISKVDFTITEDVFLQIKHTIEEDKKNDDLIFQIFNNNCLLYSKKLALMAGVEVPTWDNILNYIVPQKITQNVCTYIQKLPSFIQKVCLFITAFFLNCAQLFLGGGIIDKHLNSKQKSLAVPHINSLGDLFNTNKLYLHHPNSIGRISQHVQSWRKNEKETGVNEDEVNLKLPPEYYLSNNPVA